jgi:hypothetical protein
VQAILLASLGENFRKIALKYHRQGTDIAQKFCDLAPASMSEGRALGKPNAGIRGDQPDTL